jgi:hypothetical protein
MLEYRSVFAPSAHKRENDGHVALWLGGHTDECYTSVCGSSTATRVHTFHAGRGRFSKIVYLCLFVERRGRGEAKIMWTPSFHLWKIRGYKILYTSCTTKDEPSSTEYVSVSLSVHHSPYTSSLWNTLSKVSTDLIIGNKCKGGTATITEHDGFDYGRPWENSAVRNPSDRPRAFILCFLLISHFGGWSPTGSTQAIYWLIVPAPGDYDDGEFGGIKIGRGNRSTQRKPAPAPLCLPQIPFDQTRDRIRTAAVGSQRLTAWAMARPSHGLVSKSFASATDGKEMLVWSPSFKSITSTWPHFQTGLFYFVANLTKFHSNNNQYECIHFL